MLSNSMRCKLPPSCFRLGRPFSSPAPRAADYTHAIIGGGVVGLAAARALAGRPGTSSILLERHDAVGTETSSRNSEVVHAGIYYGRDTLKTELCVRGRALLYALCGQWGVPHRRTGKWIVAQTPAQRDALERIHRHGRDVGVPLRWVGAEEARRREPDVRAEAGVLESPETGIVDAHALMVGLRGAFEDAGGDVALLSRVVGVEPLGGRGNGTADLPGSGGWRIRVRTPSGASSSRSGAGQPGDAGEAVEEEETEVTAETIINAAGLGAVDVHNMIVPPDQQLPMFYAKGNYFSYGASKPRVGTLVYPAPEPGHAGLGTHLTLDLAGRIRFGPDVEWVDSPTDLSVNASRLSQAVREIQKYLPGVDAASLSPDYAGIRPKLGRGGAALPGGPGFVDFVVRKEPGYEGWVNLLGIESPGLTSSLAIGEMVERLLYK